MLTGAATLIGLTLGPVMVAGSHSGKRVVDRLPDDIFVAVTDFTILAAGVLFLIRR